MRTRRALAAALAALSTCAALVVPSSCGSHIVTSEFGPNNGDERTFGVGAEMSSSGPVDVREDRLVPHDGIFLSSMHFRVIYIGTPGTDQAPSADAFLSWIGPSSYWGIMSQYGVFAATYDGPIQIATSDMFPPGMIQNGLVRFADFDARVLELVHGAEGGAPVLPAADAYAFFLPDGVNIDSGLVGGQEQVTCVTSTAYHAHDGEEPYVVWPPCDDGRSTIAISHELSEMATDPVLKKGWASDDPSDIKNGAEIADICYRAVLHPADSYDVAELWSNADGDCLPK